MHITELKQSLEKEFNLVLFEDLANFCHQQRAIFDLFKKYRKDSFGMSEKLVLYSSFELEQEYINHIQRAAARCDVANFFILIVTPYDIRHKLLQANQQHGYDDVQINSKLLPLADTKIFTNASFIKDINSFCVVPFMGLELSNNTARACCKIDLGIPISVQTSALELFKSDSIQYLRDKFANGEKPKECSACWKAEQRGSTSLRLQMLNKHMDEVDQNFFDDVKLRSVSASPSTVCNFKCRICNSEVSSAIAQEELKYETDSLALKKLKSLTITPDTLSSITPAYLVESLRDAEYLHIMGGEPLLWKYLPTVLDDVVKLGYAKNIQLEFNTNGSIFPTKLLDTFAKFKSVEILLSIDDIGERFEFQRGHNWKKIFKNLVSFRDIQSKSITIKIAPTVNIQNVLYLDELYTFCKENNFDMVWWYLDKPKHLCIDRVTQYVKDVVWEKYQTHPEPELRSIAKRMNETDAMPGAEFLTYMQKLDDRRQQNFKDTHPEIFHAMSQS